jgi:hypothetical protein
VHTVYLKKLGKKDEPTCIRLGVIVCEKKIRKKG